MGQTVVLTGMVLSAAPIGEFDKRITLLTKERGKVTAFARGARRQNSQLLTAASPFSFGTFEAYEGRSSYTVVQAHISNFFQNLTSNLDGVYYGFYFLEIANYYAQENNDEKQMLNLLYLSLRALEKANLDNRLIRCIYELKTMVNNGEYPNVFSCQMCKKEHHLVGFHVTRGGTLCESCMNQIGTIPIDGSTLYTLQYIVSSAIGKLYTFEVAEPVLYSLEKIMKEYMAIYAGKKFRSLQILKEVLQENEDFCKDSG
ncbi:DNA repair protein RecO [Lachnospiraceae bacterium ZAX-1]